MVGPRNGPVARPESPGAVRHCQDLVKKLIRLPLSVPSDLGAYFSPVTADDSSLSRHVAASGREQERHMNKVFIITGASRGMGVDIARAALAAGHQVVATGRRPEAVEKAVGAHADLLVAPLDVTRPADAQAVATAAVGRFGRIDVLIDKRLKCDVNSNLIADIQD
jgi:hypothetical protein